MTRIPHVPAGTPRALLRRGVVAATTLALGVTALGVALASPAVAATGGPDSGGYTYTDSTEPGGPAAGPFTDISTTGTELDNHCDDCTTSVTFPFPIAFYGASYASGNISSNGNIQFESQDTTYTSSFPTGYGPAVAPFQTDLRTDSATGGIYTQETGTAPARQFVVQWTTVLYSDDTTPEVFQAVFTENSTRVEYRYLDVTDTPGVGVQGQANGADGLALSYGAPLTDDLAVAFSTNTNTTTTLTAKPTTPTFGQAVTFTAKVARSDGSSTVPTGSVSFFVNGSASPLGSAPLKSGVASFKTTKLPAGDDTVRAVYGGDAAAGASSRAVQLFVTTANTSTVIRPASGSTFRFGTPVTAKVAAVKPGAGTPTGSVAWYVDGGFVAETVVKSGTATLPAAALTPGDHDVQASFTSDNGNFASSDSASVSFTVTPASTTTSLALTPKTPVAGKKLTLTATVKDTVASVTPTGSVDFYDGATLLGTVALSNKATASYVIASYTAGAHDYYAVYSGDDDFAGSSSHAA